MTFKLVSNRSHFCRVDGSGVPQYLSKTLSLCSYDDMVRSLILWSRFWHFFANQQEVILCRFGWSVACRLSRCLFIRRRYFSSWASHLHLFRAICPALLSMSHFHRRPPFGPVECSSKISGFSSSDFGFLFSILKYHINPCMTLFCATCWWTQAACSMAATSVVKVCGTAGYVTATCFNISLSMTNNWTSMIPNLLSISPSYETAPDGFNKF